MDLNLHLYLFTDRELNDIILCDFKLVDTCIYNMHLFFSDHSVISKMVLHAWQGNTVIRINDFLKHLTQTFYKNLDFIWLEYYP